MAPAQRLDSPAKLRGWLADAGTEHVEVRELSNLIPATEEFCWNFVVGSGLRGLLTGLGPDVVAQVRRDFLGRSPNAACTPSTRRPSSVRRRLSAFRDLTDWGA